MRQHGIPSIGIFALVICVAAVFGGARQAWAPPIPCEFTPPGFAIQTFVVSRTANSWEFPTSICAGANTFLHNGIVDFEFYGPDGTRESQTIYSFITLENALFEVNFVATPGTLLGTHTLKVGVFSGAWTTLYQWDNQAATFEVTSTAACTGGFTIGPTVAVPSTVIVIFNAPGSGGAVSSTSTDILTHICSGTAMSNIILDFEFYGPDGAKEVQTIYRSMFAAGEQQTYQVRFRSTQGTLGTHTFKVGVFSGDWTTLYQWDNQAATFEVCSLHC